MKTLAKSLHTVTVLVRVAELFYKPGDKAWNPEDAIASAMKTLGYPDDETLDPYGLADKALKQLVEANSNAGKTNSSTWGAVVPR